MEVRLHHIAEVLEGGVDDLGHPDEGDGEDDPAPVMRRDPQPEPESDHKGRRCEVDPGVVLGAQH